jgi:nucleoside-diphosphate-sugar epimerase
VRVAVTGAQTVVGRSAALALLDAGHEVFEVEAETLWDDPEALVSALEGCDALVNLGGQMPVGFGVAHRRAWRTFDRWRSEGTRILVGAADVAGVRRIVHRSSSFVYADQGSDWVSEGSPVCVTQGTEPTSDGESAVLDYAGPCRSGVVLRLGRVIGDSRHTRRSLRSAATGRPVCVGSPEGYAHVVHSDDVGTAVVAALDAPSGLYNVGAAPVVRADLAAGFAEAVGRDRVPFVGPVVARLGGPRLEPLARSVRVTSRHFGETTGWTPRHDTFGASWFDAARLEVVGR